MPDGPLHRIETWLAYAHKTLWRAAREAETRKDQQLSDELYMICVWLGEINLRLAKH